MSPFPASRSADALRSFLAIEGELSTRRRNSRASRTSTSSCSLATTVAVRGIAPNSDSSPKKPAGPKIPIRSPSLKQVAVPALTIMNSEPDAPCLATIPFSGIVTFTPSSAMSRSSDLEHAANKGTLANLSISCFGIPRDTRLHPSTKQRSYKWHFGYERGLEESASEGGGSKKRRRLCNSVGS